MYCGMCGAELPTDARFCMRCGTPRSGVGRAGSQWEYCCLRQLDRDRYVVSLFNADLDCSEHANLGLCLYRLGLDGWEMVGITYEADPKRGYVEMWFKRALA